MISLSGSPFVLAWFGFVGAAVGSFLNVVIYRLPLGFRVGLPSRSACLGCRRRLEWFENIPIVSYLVLRGHCRRCGSTISPRYPVVELLTAMLFIAIYKFFGFSFAAFYYATFAAMLVAVTFIDLDHRIIPDAISFPGMALGALGSGFVEGHGLVSSLIGCAFGGFFFWALGWAYEKARGIEGLGFGDVKLLAMIGAFLGLKGTIGTIVLSSLFGSAVGIIVIVAQKKNLRHAIPFGPFLAIGALTFLFWGDMLALRFYPQLMGGVLIE